MKYLFTFVAALFILAPARATTLPDFHWGVGIGTNFINDLNATAFDNSGNVYATGSFNSSVDIQPGAGVFTLTSNGGSDMYLVKYNSAGNVLWAFNLTGTATINSNEYGYGVSTDNAGNVYITGHFMNTVDFDPGAGNSSLTASMSAYDAYVAKYDSNGNYLWAFSIAGGAYNSGRDLQVDANGDVVVVGEFRGTSDLDPGPGNTSLTANGINEEIFIAKYSSAGNFIWAFSLGGTAPDYIHAVDIDANGNIVVTGYYSQTVDFNPGPGTNMIVGGTDNNLFLASYDASGNYRWAFGLGDAQNDVGGGVVFDNAGDIILTGEISGTVDIDPGSGINNLITPQSNVSALFLAKYSNAGQLLWGVGLGGTVSGSSGRAVDTDQWGNIYLTGADGDEMDFDPGNGVFTLPSYANTKSFLASYTPGGVFRWAFGHITTSAATSYGLTVQVDQNNDAIVFGGTLMGSYDLDPDSTVAYVVTGGGKLNGFLGYYTYDGMIKSVSEYQAQQFSTWPNPTNGLLNLTLDGTGNGETCVEVYSCTGAIIRRINTKERTLQIDLSDEAAGVYYIRCTSGMLTGTQKFVVE